MTKAERRAQREKEIDELDAAIQKKFEENQRKLLNQQASSRSRGARFDPKTHLIYPEWNSVSDSPG